MNINIAAPPPIDIRISGRQGIAGAAGKSAYDIAVENGFVGSPEQWLASLKSEGGDWTETFELMQHIRTYGR